MTEPPQQRDLIGDDQALVRRLVARDEAAWVEFVARYDRLLQSRILAACRETGRANGLAELVSEISAELYAALVEQDMKVLRSYSGRSRLSTWLAVIARRVALRHVCRLSRVTARADLDACVPLAEQTSDETQRHQRLQLVALARSQLSPRDQLLLRLFYDESRSYKEIAQQLAISVNAVGPKLDRARQRLRRLMERLPSQRDGPLPGASPAATPAAGLDAGRHFNPHSHPDP
ncbi:MAG: sigma-70 family RNA polymerase sigma factor [Pirellulaceae bacterium]|nr:sigma-70 family RNA polymerase sigma factor [Pirellulaceae bacterium]